MSMSALHTLPEIKSPAAPAISDAGLEKSKRRRNGVGGAGRSSDSKLQSSKRRMEFLTEEYNKTKSEREALELELGRRGLLASALDNDMFFPIMRSADALREACLLRCRSWHKQRSPMFS